MIWKPVVGYEGLYEVSDAGEVRSVDRIIKQKYRDGYRNRHLKGRIRKQAVEADSGYKTITLWNHQVAHTYRVHKLVLEAFKGPAPKGMEGCHEDGDQSNNYLTNLRWDTRANNISDIVRHGRHAMANRDCCPLNHLLVAPNLIPSLLPKRGCLACDRGRGIVRSRRRANQPIPELREIADQKYVELGFTLGRTLTNQGGTR